MNVGEKNPQETYYQDIAEHQSTNSQKKKRMGISRVSDFSKVTLEATRKWSNVFKVLRASYY